MEYNVVEEVLSFLNYEPNLIRIDYGRNVGLSHKITQSNPGSHTSGNESMSEVY